MGRDEGDRDAESQSEGGGEDEEESAAHEARSAPGADHPVCLPLRASPTRPYNRRSGGRQLRSARGVAPRARPARPGGRARGAMSSRLAPALLVGALLVATSAALVVTEQLKLTRSPIVGPIVAKVFSPTCDCPTAAAEIRFRLRKPGSRQRRDRRLGRERRPRARARPSARAGASRHSSGTGGTTPEPWSRRGPPGRGCASTGNAGPS